MTDKEKYREYCLTHNEVPLFLTFNWLETISSDEDWDVVMVEKGGEIFGVMPFVTQKKKGLKFIVQPHLTPFLGLWIKYPEGQKESTKISHEKEVMQELIAKLPKYDHLRLKFSHQRSNALPFYWAGFTLNTRYTYVVETEGEDFDPLGKVHQSVRRQLKKADKLVKINKSDNIDLLYSFKKSAYAAENNNVPFNESYLKGIFELCKREGCGELLSAEDEDGNVHALVLLVWDNNCCYYLAGASNPDFKNSGAMSKLMMEGILKAQALGLSYNFEGGMIESIERFFRNFGAKQAPYIEIEKTNSLLFKLYQQLFSR